MRIVIFHLQRPPGPWMQRGSAERQRLPPLPAKCIDFSVSPSKISWGDKRAEHKTLDASLARAQTEKSALESSFEEHFKPMKEGAAGAHYKGIEPLSRAWLYWPFIGVGHWPHAQANLYRPLYIRLHINTKRLIGRQCIHFIYIYNIIIIIIYIYIIYIIYIYIYIYILGTTQDCRALRERARS